MGGIGERFPFIHWLIMGIGGRIPPLLEACALLFDRILPWFDFLVMRQVEFVKIRDCRDSPEALGSSPNLILNR